MEWAFLGIQRHLADVDGTIENYWNVSYPQYQEIREAVGKAKNGSDTEQLRSSTASWRYSPEFS